MNRVFILDKICLNVDNETDVQNLIRQGAKEIKDLSIFKGYENLVSPTNTVVNDDGSITFTAPKDKTQEQLEQEQAEKELAELNTKIEQLKTDFFYATMTNDTEQIEKIKSEYNTLIGV